MHPFWLIDDLVRCVLLHCEKLKDVSMLGRTCQTLFPSTLDVIWREPPITALISILQEGSGTYHEFHRRAQFGSYGAPVHSRAVARFRLYAGHVLYLFLGEYEDNFHTPQIRNALSSRAVDKLISQVASIPPLHTFFPRLRSVSIHAISIRGFELGLQLCAPTLPHLKLELRSAPFMYEHGHKVFLGPQGTASLVEVLSKLPRIDSLHLTAWEETWPRDMDYNALSNILSALTWHFPMITRIEANAPDFEAAFLSKLGCMPSIEELDITYRSSAGQVPHTVLMYSPSLCRVDARFKSGQQCLDFLQYLTSPNLRHIYLGLTALFVSEDLDGITTAVAEKWPELTYFGIFWFDLNMATGLPSMLFTPFEPLYKCSLIETVIIRVRMGFDLTNRDLREIGRSWPSLKHLTIAGTSDMRPVVPVGLPMNSLSGLSELVSRCTDLHEISMRIALTANLDLISPSSSRVQIFNIQDSPPADAAEAAAAIRKLFPALRKLVFSKRLPIHNEPAFHVYDASRKRFGESLQRRLNISSV